MGRPRQSDYKGVWMRKWGKWVSEIRQPNRRARTWLGTYDTEEEAARAHDAAVFYIYGPSSEELINFPDDLPPDIPSGKELSQSEIREVASSHAQKVAELKQPSAVVEDLFSEQPGSSKLIDFMGGKGDMEEGDGGSKAGLVFDTSRMWNFGFDTSLKF